jgi:hypothetical protein
VLIYQHSISVDRQKSRVGWISWTAPLPWALVVEQVMGIKPAL